MGRAKDIIVKVIPAQVATPFVKAHHYSGRVVTNSCLHFGVFMDGVLHGVMSFGPSMDKKKTIGLIEGTRWNEFLELNRMAFDDELPKNSESRAISIAIRLIKKNAPHIRWIISFADGTQCGDGTIYRAAGFVLTGIKPNKTIIELPNGQRFTDLSLRVDYEAKSIREVCAALGIECKYRTTKEWLDLGAKFVEGNMMRYIYIIDKSCRLTVPIIPFDEIKKKGASMYKGQFRKEFDNELDS